jgi:hypothetical protein
MSQDKRICEAIQTIGALVELELSDEQITEAIMALETLTVLARHRKTARARRLAGQIQAASLYERMMSEQYDSLPEEYRW